MRNELRIARNAKIAKKSKLKKLSSRILRGVRTLNSGDLWESRRFRQSPSLVFLRLSRQPLDPFGDRRMSGEQAADVHSKQRLHDEQVRR